MLLEATFEPENGSATSVPPCFDVKGLISVGPLRTMICSALGKDLVMLSTHTYPINK